MSEVVVVIGPDRSVRRSLGGSAPASWCWPTCARRTRTPRPRCSSNAGFDVSTAIVDVSSRASVRRLVETATAGDVTGLIHAAGVSPEQASPETILAVDLYGTAVVLEEFGNVIAAAGPVS